MAKKASDPFNLIVPTRVESIALTMVPLDLEAIADEAIAMLVEKLGAQDAKI